MAAFGLLNLIGGWLIVVGGGFHHAQAKFNRDTVFVDGPTAGIMAILQLSMGALALTWLLQQKTTTTRAAWIGFGLALLPPGLYLLIWS